MYAPVQLEQGRSGPPPPEDDDGEDGSDGDARAASLLQIAPASPEFQSQLLDLAPTFQGFSKSERRFGFVSLAVMGALVAVAMAMILLGGGSPGPAPKPAPTRIRAPSAPSRKPS